MARRSKSREIALQMLFQVDLNPDVDGRTVRRMIEQAWVCNECGAWNFVAVSECGYCNASLQSLEEAVMNPEKPAPTPEPLLDEPLRDFAWQLFAGVMEFRPQLDEQIQAVAHNWKLSRMAATDRNCLRQGAFELLHTDTPHRVVIDEALELAKKFGSEQSAQFVNGVLDKLVPAEKRANDATVE
jgi:N utilization substance protein B